MYTSCVKLTFLHLRIKISINDILERYQYVVNLTKYEEKFRDINLQREYENEVLFYLL